MLQLKLIGYWRSEQAEEWPDPAAFVDPEWDPATRDRVVDYLCAGFAFVVAAGTSWCRFRCLLFGSGGLGSAELTDGEFCWPGGLAHYVAQHAVRLPDDFVAAAVSRKAPALRGLSFDHGDYTVDTEWWRAQRGFGGRAMTYTSPAPLGRLIARTAGVEPSAAVLRQLRLCPELSGASISDLREAIGRGDDLLLLTNVIEASLVELRRDLEQLGLRTVFHAESKQWF